MLSNTLALSAFALFSAHVVASCSSDNCFRAFLGSSSSASAYCSSLFNPSNSPTIPPFAAACSSSTSRLSSACSCILTTTVPPTSSTTTPITSTCPTVPISTITVSTYSPTTTSSCPTPPPSTVTVTSVTTSTVSTCPVSSTSPPPCSCTNLLANPDFDGTVAPWQIINNDPNARWSLAPSPDIPAGAFAGEWALQWSWQTGATIPNGAFGLAQTVSIPSCCVGPQMELTFAILNPNNVCNMVFYDNLGGGALAESLSLGVNGVAVGVEWFAYPQFFAFGEVQEFEFQVLIECQPPVSDIWIGLVSLNQEA